MQTTGWSIFANQFVLDYLGSYTHRVAISNNRILSIDNGRVRFGYKNRQTGKTDNETIDAVEFIRRFLLHVLPKRFMRIRHYGFLANRYKKNNVKLCRKFLGRCADLPQIVKESIHQIMLRLTGVDIARCPCCKKGTMMVVASIPKGSGPSGFDILHPP